MKWTMTKKEYQEHRIKNAEFEATVVIVCGLLAILLIVIALIK